MPLPPSQSTEEPKITTMAGTQTPDLLAAVNELRKEIQSIRGEFESATKGSQVQEGVVVTRSELRPGLKQFKLLHALTSLSWGPNGAEKMTAELESLNQRSEKWIQEQYASSPTFRVVSIVPSETAVSQSGAFVWTISVHYLH